MLLLIVTGIALPALLELKLAALVRITLAVSAEITPLKAPAVTVAALVPS